MLAARVLFYFGAEATYSQKRSPLSGGGRKLRNTFREDMVDLFSPYWYYCKPDEDSIIRVFIIYAVMFNINGLLLGNGVSLYMPLAMLFLYVFLKGSFGAFHLIELFIWCFIALKLGFMFTILGLIEERLFLSVFRELKQGP